MTDKYHAETIQQRLQKKYRKTENEQVRKGILEAAEAIMNSSTAKEVIKKEAKRSALKEQLKENDDIIPYKNYVQIEEDIEYERYEKAEQQLKKFI